MATVRIPTVLRKHTDGEAKPTADGATVGEVFGALVARFPDLQDKLYDGEGLRGFINVYVDDEDIRYLDGVNTPVEPNDEISIMPAVAGGSDSLRGAFRDSLRGAFRSLRALHAADA